MVRSPVVRSLLLVCAALVRLPAAADDRAFELGFRGNILLGRGEPANDMVGEGLVGRFAINDRWRLGVALDHVKFDYETPNRTLGIEAESVVDGLNEWQRLSVFAERRYGGERAWNWHWLAGVGSASVDRIGDVAGRRSDGSTFDIATLAEDELHVFAGAGLHRAIGRRWLVVTSLTIEHHTTDYELSDRVSGARGAIGSQSVYGIAVEIGYRF